MFADDPFARTALDENDAAGDALVVAHDASYCVRGYRSFEFASFSARAGEVLALFGTDRVAARDMALACAGLVRPTAGALSVAGVDVAGRARLAAGIAGVGVFSGFVDADGSLIVEECVGHELRLRRAAGVDVLEYLAEFGLATQAEQRVDMLAPAARAQLSAALACAGGVRIAALDLDDPFVDGLSTRDARLVVTLAQRYARAHRVCVVVATREPAVACAADAVVALDIPAAEALACQTAASSEEVGAA